MKKIELKMFSKKYDIRKRNFDDVEMIYALNWHSTCTRSRLYRTYRRFAKGVMSEIWKLMSK